MSEAKSRQFHSSEFKAKVGLEALHGVKTINEIGQEYGVHPVTVRQWKKAIQEQAITLFEGKRGPKPVAAHREPELLFSEIGKLKVELDWLKKSPESADKATSDLDCRIGVDAGGTTMRTCRGSPSNVLRRPASSSGRRGRQPANGVLSQ
jgi:transposase